MADKKAETETPTPKLYPHRVLGGQHSRNEASGRKVYVAGDTMMLPENHGLRGMVERIHDSGAGGGAEKVAETPTKAKGATETETETTPPETLDADISAADLIALIPEYDDKQQLQDLRREEREGKNRTTVLAAIEKRLKELRA